jgi:hypothetical protein
MLLLLLFDTLSHMPRLSLLLINLSEYLVELLFDVEFGLADAADATEQRHAGVFVTTGEGELLVDAVLATLEGAEGADVLLYTLREGFSAAEAILACRNVHYFGLFSS